MTNKELNEIRAKISCPDLGDDHYGEWGILTRNQRFTIKRMLDYIDIQGEYIIRKEAEIEELEYKLGCLLCHATGGKLSKHTYPLNTMYSAVNDEVQDCCDEAAAEAIKEFAERLKPFADADDVDTHNIIDNLVKEMEGISDERN